MNITMNFNQGKIYWIWILLFANLVGSNAQKIKIACVGNSVTYGMGIQDRAEQSYPAQLQQLLGEEFEVANFGHSGATMLKKGHKPFWLQAEFQKSKEFEPNIVVIHLGLNDQGLNNWPDHKNEFIADYLEMISQYKKLPSKPRILICKMTPTFSGHHWFEEGMRENFKEIQSQIEEIAIRSQVQLIDLHEPLYRFPELFLDDLHPSEKGAAIIAKKVFSSITGDFGGLQLPMLYGEKMVFQRNVPIVISGYANVNDTIEVSYHHTKKKTIVGSQGKWELTFPPQRAGGPFKLLVSSNSSKGIVINETYVGEVWLASGQSNMGFKVKEMKHAASVLKDSLNPNIFLYSLDAKVLKSDLFSDSDLKLCNSNDYFESSGWSNNQEEVLSNFSAVAYAFAYNLQKELNVPIGIICNAIGGSPTQSWISREHLEMKHQTVDLLNDMWRNPMTDPWVAKRKFENFGNAKKTTYPARHPYDPSMLFDAGILPIKHHTIKGVIWYQGESNVQQVDLHSNLFSMLVDDWRMHWQLPELPFYFVQLSSMDRPNWGRFRDSQRRLLNLPYTGMAVSSDVGNPTDVHPKQKWVIGKRLAAIALSKSYNKNIPYSGPLLDFVNVIQDTLALHFKFSDGLKTTDGKSVKDIYVSGSNRNFYPAETKIQGNKLLVWSAKVGEPRYVRYGYTPFTLGNLTNQFNLPASTFSNETKIHFEIEKTKTYSPHYYNKLAIFQSESDTEEEIIFLGDSITEEGKWSELFPNENVINRGISGDVTDGVLNRLDEITSSNPKKIFLLIGTNDLARGKEINYVLNVVRKIIIEILKKSKNTSIYLQSILPVNPNVGNQFSGHKINHHKIMETNLKLEEMTKLFNIEYIDIHKALRSSDNYLKHKFTYDGLHLNASGYQKWKQTILKYVN